MMGFLNMRSGVFVSVSAHLLVVLLVQFGLPSLFTPRDVSVTIIPVELVTEDQLNAPPPPAVPEPEPEPEPEAAAPPPPPPEPEPEPEPVPEPEVVEAPPPPPVEKPKPPEHKEPPKPEPSELAKAKPQAKPKPPAPKRDFNSVLKDLDRPDKKSPPAPKKPETSTPEKKDKPAPEQQVAERASITEIERLKQMIRRQIEPCWSPPVGAAEAENLVVTIFIRVDQKGFVREARVIDAPAMALNAYVQAAADAARRAVLNPRCQPFELPINRYDLWKEIRFNFDPREMLG